MARTGNLTVQMVAPSGAASQQLRSATVTQDLANSRLTGTLVLRGTPTAATRTPIDVTLGYNDNGECNVSSQLTLDSYQPGAQGSRSGATITFSKAGANYRTGIWDCAVVVVGPSGGWTHALGGGLSDRRADVRVSAPSKKSVKPKKWRTIKIRVANRGNWPVSNVRARLQGRGVKFKKSRSVNYGTIAPGRTKTKNVRVRVSGKSERIAFYTVSASGVRETSDSIRLLPSYKRKKAAPGKYKGKNAVSFRVSKKRQVTGWRTRLTVTCGGYPSTPTTQVGWYDFPKKVKIGKSGRIDATHKGRNYSVWLRATFDGKRVRDGYFHYSGPGNCRGTTSWTAKRGGR